MVEVKENSGQEKQDLLFIMYAEGADTMGAITRCRVCHSGNITNVLSLGDQYLAVFTAEDNKPEKYPLDVVLCEDCYLVQLQHTTPRSSLYTENYGYKSGINTTIKSDLAEIAQRAIKEVEKPHSVINTLDIGANDGTLLTFYPEHYCRVACEPIKKFAKECKQKGIKVINDFFSYEAVKQKISGQFDIITAISCFYDLDDPNKFVSDIVRLFADKGVFIVQQNYLVAMLKQNAFDNIVHEHLEFYSLLALENLLERHGLEVYRVEQNTINGGSFRTYIQHKGVRLVEQSVIDMREEEQQLKLDDPQIYADFAVRVKKRAEILHTFIEKKVREGKTSYLYGASTRGNTLLQFAGLDNHLVKAAVERNPEKWGKKIASVGIPIISEEQARKEHPDYMLCLPWFFFFPEMREREEAYIQAGGKFILPLPNPVLVTKEGNVKL
jgi:SAM-dependent methyltransferase